MFAVDALVREAGDAFRKMPDPVTRHGRRFDASHRRFAHDFDEQFAGAIGDDFHDGVVVQPVAKGPERVFEENGSGNDVPIDEPWRHGAAP